MSKKKLVIATNNPDKFREIMAILDKLPLDFTPLGSMNLPEETGKTLEENAILKAKAASEFFNEIALADDTGLEVEILGNAPGIYSARFAGVGNAAPSAANYKRNREKLLTLLEDKPMEQRKAKFRCVVAVVHHGVTNSDDIKTFEGEVKGYITDKEIGKQGFGYDSVFLVSEFGKTFAQLTAEEKNKISHRAIALLKAKKYLENLINIGE